MKHLLFAAFMILVAIPAFAQSGSGEPIEITATETVEWLRGQNQYVARKDVIVTQGKMQIFADLLTADYREGATSSTEIYKLTAEGDVQIKDETNTAYGDLGVYDVTAGIATLTGHDLKLVSPDQTVTAKERMEYHSNERMAKAIGNAVVTRPQDTLKADVITAFFKDAAAPQGAQQATASPLGGGGNLDRLEADGHVVITTPSEVLSGNKAIYRAANNTAELRGNVKVKRGENILEGERAEVDLTTNISKMFGSETTGGRVRGVFFPGSEKKADNKGQDKKTPPPVTFKAAPATAPLPEPATAPAPTPEEPAAPAPVPADSASPLTPAPARVSPRIDY